MKRDTYSKYFVSSFMNFFLIILFI